MIQAIRLYFEPLKEEYVFNIIKREQEKGKLLGSYQRNLGVKLQLN